jgi:hypothetical protein
MVTVTGKTAETGGNSPGIDAGSLIFGLGDWAPRERAVTGSRQLRMHRIYFMQADRMGVRCGFIFTVDDVAERDGWTCAVCGAPVLQRWVAAELGQAPALTFAVAWADGGQYDKANARLAHFGCAVSPDEGLRRRVGQLLVRDLAVKAHAAAGDETCSKGHALTAANLLKSGDGRRRCRQCRNGREREQPGAGS